MAQHFLLSAAARTLSVIRVARMSEEEAVTVFRKIRWPDTDGAPVCPHCASKACYEYKSRPIFRCQLCGKQFSMTSGTLFASRKLPIRDYLVAVAVFVNGASGKAALEIGRQLGVQYKTAFVLGHKLREAMGTEMRGAVLGGPGTVAEVDGAWFGGHVKPANEKANRK